MASTFSSALNLELQASGENSGTWGVITNNNLQKVESAIKGYVSIAIASTSDSLDTSDGSTTDEQSHILLAVFYGRWFYHHIPSRILESNDV